MACPDEALLARVVENAASTDERANVEGHLASCEACRVLLAHLVRAQSGSNPARAAAAPSEETLARGTTLGRYVLLEPLGRGGMGVVFAAWDPTLDRKVALKLVRFDADGDEARARLLREAQALARLKDPQVITVYDAGIWEDRVFIAMEFVDGATLKQHLARARPEPREVLALFSRAGKGLLAAHAAGLVHRDFKPDNVLVDGTGRVLVTDFGLARQASAKEAAPQRADSAGSAAELTRTGALVGTPAYMSPEQLAGHSATARSDQFSFCVSLYEALYGARPFPGATVDEVRARLASGAPPALPARPGIGVQVRAALARGLSLRPEARFEHMEALLAALAVRPRTTLRAVAVIATASASVAGLLAIASQSPEALCSGAEAKLAGAWDASRAAQVGSAFTASTQVPAARAQWEATARTLDGWARLFVHEHEEACRATRVRGEQSEAVMSLRMACLDVRRRELATFVELLERPDAALVARAPSAAASLTRPDACADIAALTAPVPIPEDPARRQKVLSVREGLAAVNAQQVAGQYPAALEAATALSREAEAVGYRPVEAEVFVQLGRLHTELTQLPAADEALTRAVLAAQAGGHTEAAGEAWLYRVALAREQARFADAHAHARHVRAIIERLGGHPRLEASLAREVGKVLETEARFDEALAEFERALQLRTRELGGDHPLVGAVLNSIGNVLRDKGQLDEAAKQFERARALFVAAYGEGHPHVAQAYKNLGNVAWSRGQADEAIALYQKAHGIQARVYGEGSVEAASTQNNIAAVYTRKGRLDDAIATYKEILTLYERTLGPDHPQLHSVLNNLAVTLQMKGDLPAAHEILTRALHVAEKAHGPEHPEVETALLNLGDVLINLGRAKEAIPGYLRAIAIAEKKNGPDHPNVAEDLAGLGFAYLALKEPHKAIPPLERSLTILERGDPRTRGIARFALARALYESRRDKKRARILYMSALADFDATGQPGLRAEAEAWRKSHP